MKTSQSFAYGGSRIDMAWAKRAAGHGMMLEQIKDELLSCRDLNQKSSRKRQLEYVERAAPKVLRQTEHWSGCLRTYRISAPA